MTRSTYTNIARICLNAHTYSSDGTTSQTLIRMSSSRSIQPDINRHIDWTLRAQEREGLDWIGLHWSNGDWKIRYTVILVRAKSHTDQEQTGARFKPSILSAVRRRFDDNDDGEVEIVYIRSLKANITPVRRTSSDDV